MCGREQKQILLFHYVEAFEKAPEGAFLMSGVAGKPRLPQGSLCAFADSGKGHSIRYQNARPTEKKTGFFRYKARMYKLVEDRKNKGTYS